MTPFPKVDENDCLVYRRRYTVRVSPTSAPAHPVRDTSDARRSTTTGQVPDTGVLSTPPESKETEEKVNCSPFDGSTLGKVRVPFTFCIVVLVPALTYDLKTGRETPYLTLEGNPRPRKPPRL